MNHGYEIDLDRTIQDIIRTHLDDEELLVRISLVGFMKELAITKGVIVWDMFKRDILSLVEENFNRNITHRAVIKMTRNKKTNVMHSTEGYHALDSSLKVLSSVIEGLGIQFLHNLSPQFMDMVYLLLVHPNRFVRETGFSICKAVIDIADEDTMSRISLSMGQAISNGLLDQWGHVELSAARACRSFVLKLKTMKEDSISNILPHILPTMCFMRYHIADGLRNFCIETWRQFVEDKGKTLLVKYLPDTIDLYMSLSSSDNAGLRETACLCIGEIFSKIDKSLIYPYEVDLLKIIESSLSDESWPVREAACLAYQSYFENYPSHSGEFILDRLFEALADEFLAVRQNAAGALASLAKNNLDLKDSILSTLKQSLIEVEKQEPDSHIDWSIEQTFGPIAKESRDNDPHLHSKQDIFCCECHVHKLNPCAIHKKADPWRKSDGSLYLIKELVQLFPEIFKEYVLLVLQSAKVKPSFAHYDTFIQSLFKEMTTILQSLKDTSILDSELVSSIVETVLQVIENDNLSYLTKSNINELLKQLIGRWKSNFIVCMDNGRQNLLKQKLKFELV